MKTLNELGIAPTPEKAEDFRVKCIRGVIESLNDMREEYNKSAIDFEIAELRKLLDKKCA